MPQVTHWFPGSRRHWSTAEFRYFLWAPWGNLKCIPPHAVVKVIVPKWAAERTTAFRPPTLTVTPHFHRAIRFGQSGLGPSEADCLNHQMPLSLSLPQSHLNPEGAMYSHNVDTENALDFHGTPGSA